MPLVGWTLIASRHSDPDLTSRHICSVVLRMKEKMWNLFLTARSVSMADFGLDSAIGSSPE